MASELSENVNTIKGSGGLGENMYQEEAKS